MTVKQLQNELFEIQRLWQVRIESDTGTTIHPHQSINQSINAEFVGRRYTTRPGAPAESVNSTTKKYILESFSKCTGISNIMKFGWKSVPGGWTGVEEAMFTKSCSCSWQNVGL